MQSLETTCGMRWKVEGLFSSFKRIFGEEVWATSREGMKMNCYKMLVTMVA